MSDNEFIKIEEHAIIAANMVTMPRDPFLEQMLPEKLSKEDVVEPFIVYFQFAGDSVAKQELILTCFF